MLRTLRRQLARACVRACQVNRAGSPRAVTGSGAQVRATASPDPGIVASSTAKAASGHRRLHVCANPMSPPAVTLAPPPSPAAPMVTCHLAAAAGLR